MSDSSSSGSPPLDPPSSSSSPSTSTPSSSSPSTSSSSPSTSSEIPTPLPSRSEIFNTTLSGARSAPLLPPLSSDPPARLQPLTRSLPAYVAQEGGSARRLARLRALWEKLPSSPDADARPAPMELNLSSVEVVGEPEGGGAMRRSGGTHTAGVEAYGLTPERAGMLRELYFQELAKRCETPESVQADAKGKAKAVDWEGFVKYADEKEQELWTIFHHELDLDRNGHLDASEWADALGKAGITLDPHTLQEFMTFLTSSTNSSKTVSYPEFRDFLLLMPHHASTAEIYRYYKMRKFDHDSRGASRINMEGDVSLSAEDRRASSPPRAPHRTLEAPALPNLPGAPDHSHPSSSSSDSSSSESASPHSTLPIDYSAPTHPDDTHHEEEEEEEDEPLFGGNTAFKFLLAGGVAGVISRTATAPFDRLKVYLITATPEQLMGVSPGRAGGNPGTGAMAHEAMKAAQALKNGNPAAGVAAVANGASHGSAIVLRAVHSLYRGGGVRAFWVGNGLNVTKILPESAIKFLSYETSKRFFAKYYDEVEDTRDISGISRFISGGIGGITSQLSIYPIETLKTQMMSTKEGGSRRDLMTSARAVWALGGVPAFYRGLVIGLVGVFPYSAIDMSTFEALKIAYARSTGQPEPSVLAMLAFGSLSGSVGATAVYPLNLVRTRLQASGSSGHPQRYTGMMDVVHVTYAREGWKGFYKGLVPTLAKVVPAVSISYVVYEKSKRALGVA